MVRVQHAFASFWILQSMALSAADCSSSLETRTVKLRLPSDLLAQLVDVESEGFNTQQK